MIDGIMLALMKHGIEVNEELRLIVNSACVGFDVSPVETELIVYTGKNENLIQRFILNKAVAGCTKRTLEYYARSVGNILAAIGKDADAVTADDIKLFVAKRMTSGVSKVTINNEQRCLSSFYAWLGREEIVTRNPMLRVDRIKTRPEKEKAFDDMDVERIRMACRTNRERCIVEMLLSTGCRVSELVQIRTADIENGRVDILGKGEKWRTVYLNARAQLAVKVYVDERRDDSPYLFPRMAGGNHETNFKNPKIRQAGPLWYKDKTLVDTEKPCDKGTVEHIMREAGKRSGVSNVHPHRFRRTCATVALRNGMPLELVSKMLGHASIATTQIYLDIRDEDLANAHKRYVR